MGVQRIRRVIVRTDVIRWCCNIWTPKFDFLVHKDHFVLDAVLVVEAVGLQEFFCVRNLKSSNRIYLLLWCLLRVKPFDVLSQFLVTGGDS